MTFSGSMGALPGLRTSGPLPLKNDFQASTGKPCVTLHLQEAGKVIFLKEGKASTESVFLRSCGEKTLCAQLDTGTRGQNSQFSSEEPEHGAAQQLLQNASRCCFLPSDRASFAPRFGISEARGQPATPLLGPIGGARCPRPGDPSMTPGPLRHTPAAVPMGRTALT